jgi:ferritin
MGIAIGKRIHEALNKQINEELIASYLFMAMSNVFEDMRLKGCAHWAHLQSREKYARAMQIYRHLMDRAVKIKFLPIPAPKQEWRAPLHIFEDIVRLEQKMSVSFYAFYEVSLAEKDYLSQPLLLQFIEKQRKAEMEAEGLLDRLRKMQGTDVGVLMFDENLAKLIREN